MMNVNELRQKSRQELERAAAEHRARIRDTRFTVASRQVRSVRSLRDAKRDLARILTILAEKN